MRAIKYFSFLAIVGLLFCGLASATNYYTSANGSTKIKPAVKDGVVSVTVFDDVAVTSSGTYWSNPIQIDMLDFTRGTNRNLAYINVGWAFANTQTSSNNGITATYQLSHDGKNFFSPPDGPCLTSYGIFGTSATDGFDPAEGTGQGSAVANWSDIGTAAGITYGAGPYLITNTKVVEVTLTQAKYIRFAVKADSSGTAFGDLFFVGATRKME